MCELQNFWLVVNGNDVLLLDIFLLLYIRYCTFCLNTVHSRAKSDYLLPGRPTRGPRKGFEWPDQYFLKPSVPSILAEIEDRFDVKTPFFVFFFKF